jgi:hypothetical protein
VRSIARWRHLMSSRVLIAARSTEDRYGAPSFGADVAYDAHLARRRKIVRNEMGQEVVSNQAVYLNGAPDVAPTCRVTLSTADVGSTAPTALTPPVMAVERRFDQSGPHHTVLYLG